MKETSNKIESRLVRLDHAQVALIYGLVNKLMTEIEGKALSYDTMVKCMSDKLYLDALSISIALTTQPVGSQN
jgi:hypothetical protein